MYHLFFILFFLVSTTGAHQQEFAGSPDQVCKALSGQQIAPFVVHKVTFTSDTAFEQSEFDYLVDIKSGQKICQRELHKACWHLGLKRRFEKLVLTLKPGPQGMCIHFILTGHWLFHALKLQGLMHGREQYRQYYTLQPGDPFTHQQHLIGIERIKEGLAQCGYLNAKVVARCAYDKRYKRVNVSVALSKGTRFSIGSVDVVINNPELADHITRWSKTALCGAAYTADKVQAYIEQLDRYVMQQGFEQPAIELSKKICRHKGVVDLTLCITVDNTKIVRFLGNQFFSQDQLREHIWLPGMMAQDIVQLYRSNGFLQATVQETVQGNRSIFTINEGPRERTQDTTPQPLQVCPDISRSGQKVASDAQNSGQNQSVKPAKIIVRGSSSIPFNFVMRELADGQRGIQNLRDRDIFERIALYPAPEALDNQQRPIILELVQDDPIELRARLGFQQVSKRAEVRDGMTYKIGGSFIAKNVTNRADRFSLDVDLTRFYRTLEAHYDIPWLWGTPVNTRVKIYCNTSDQPLFVARPGSFYKATQNGLALSFSDLHQPDTSLTCGLEWIGIKDVSQTLACALDFCSNFNERHVPFIFIEPSIALEYCDNKQNPTMGSFTRARVKSMFCPYGSYMMLKFLIEQSFFYPCGPLVCALRMRAGTIIHDDFCTILLPERFYLGGSTTIRSYEPEFAPPLGCFFDQCGQEHLIPQGGRTMLLCNLETRFDIYGNLAGVLFQDVGTLSKQGLMGSFLGASGFGLRYRTPLGPVRFDIGWKWHRIHPAERGYAWYLTFGHAF